MKFCPSEAVPPAEDFVRFEHRNCFFSLGDHRNSHLVFVRRRMQLPAQIALFAKKGMISVKSSWIRRRGIIPLACIAGGVFSVSWLLDSD